jgi:hypothetical protein
MVITEPAAAYAASRCLAARVRDVARWTTAQHPTRCGWCDLPTDVLDRMISGFNELVEYDRRNRTSASGAGAFGRLQRDEQLAQILAAQQLEDEPPPAPARIADLALAAAAQPPSPPVVQVTVPASGVPVAAAPAAAASSSRPSWAKGRR